jgi:hypothetical protein
VAAAVVEKSDLKIQHGNELKNVRVSPPMLLFTESLILFLFRRSKVSDEASGLRSRINASSVHDEVRRSRSTLNFQSRAREVERSSLKSTPKYAQKEQGCQEAHDRSGIGVRQPGFFLPYPPCIDVEFRGKAAEALYDTGWDAIPRLNPKGYKDTLSPGAERGLKYIANLEFLMPRENAEALVVRCCSPMRLVYKSDEDQRVQ